MTSCIPPSLSDRLLEHKLAVVAGLAVLTALALVIGYPTLGTRVNVLLALPVLTIAYLYGLKLALVAWCVGLSVDILVHSNDLNALVEHGIFYALMLLIAAVAVGRLYDNRISSPPQPGESQESAGAFPAPSAFSQQIAESIPDLLYIFDLKESRNVYSNRSLHGMLGYEPDSVRTLDAGAVFNLVHPDDAMDLQDEMDERLEMLRQGKVTEVEYRIKSASGEWRWLHGREAVFTRSDDGSPRQLIGLAHDITERKQVVASLLANEKREGAVEKERELMQLKTRLMETISHEFRTPLSIILASGELLELYFDRLSPARRSECVASIKTQVMHLREMLDDITMLTGGESFQPVFRPSPLNLEAFFKRIVAELQSSVSFAYKLDFTADGDLSAVMADEELLRPILRNLLGNSIKYSAIGETIWLHLARQGNEVVFTVSDSGIGIPQEEQSHIFETFHRARNVSHTGGLGLGLKIVRELVQLHQGTITFQSVEGQGTTFTVRLPVVEA